MALVALAIAAMLMAAQASTMLTRQRLQRQLQAKVQAQWLAESALDRARVQRRHQADYAGEAWQPLPAEKSQDRPQPVSIRIETEADRPTLVVVAEVGRAGGPFSARHELRQTLANPSSGATP
jgi:type II secretory pathway pseudopilin PulG